MIKFRSLSDTDTALAHSPLVHAAEKTFAYIDAHGPAALSLDTDDMVRRVTRH